MGNAVGPVALIAAGIYLGYLTLAGKSAALVALLKGNSATTTTTPAATGTISTLPTMSFFPIGGTTNGVQNDLPNLWGAMNATPQQALINSQIPLTIDPGSLVGTGGG